MDGTIALTHTCLALPKQVGDILGQATSNMPDLPVGGGGGTESDKGEIGKATSDMPDLPGGGRGGGGHGECQG